MDAIALDLSTEFLNNLYREMDSKFPESSICSRLFHQLISPVENLRQIHIGADSFSIITPTDMDLLNQSASIVNYAYFTMYHNCPTEITVSEVDKFNTFDSSLRMVTISAIQEISGSPWVLATITFAWGADVDIQNPSNSKLDLFQLFSVENEKLWPHQEQSRLPVEVKRLAFHPIFDVLRNQSDHKTLTFFRTLLLRKMYRRFLELIRNNQQIWMGFILGPHVANFFQYRAQFSIKPIAGVGPRDSLYSHLIRSEYPRYWKPIYSKQPTVYEAPLSLPFITEEINGKKIVF